MSWFAIRTMVAQPVGATIVCCSGFRVFMRAVRRHFKFAPKTPLVVQHDDYVVDRL